VFGTSNEHVRTIAAELPHSTSVSTAAGKLDVDPARLYGRRLGWYIVTRLTHPELVVETGVHDGIGAVILTEALRRNAAEGALGAYRGTDIDPKAGWLLQAPDIDAEVLYGDSITSLEKLEPGSVDLFINDSDHSADYEYREYQVMTTRLSPRAVILGDNSHATDSLLDYSCETDRDFIFFDERPADHWYPGAGIGISVASTGR
jgi:predicted O-methyltransferase YrrM